MNLLPSLLYPDFEQFSARFYECVELGREIHIDFADGDFVPNRLPSIDKVIPLPGDIVLEAHFMVQNPAGWVESALADDRFKTLIVHAEADVDVPAIAVLVKNAGRRIGLALKPGTTIESVIELLPLVDEVLVLQVDPGFNGSPFQPEMVHKIKLLREKFPHMVIEADGGMNPTTLPLVQTAGADKAAIGSYLHDKVLREGIENLEKALQGSSK